jgi:hypothetical protein
VVNDKLHWKHPGHTQRHQGANYCHLCASMYQSPSLCLLYQPVHLRVSCISTSFPLFLHASNGSPPCLHVRLHVTYDTNTRSTVHSTTGSPLCLMRLMCQPVYLCVSMRSITKMGGMVPALCVLNTDLLTVVGRGPVVAGKDS